MIAGVILAAGGGRRFGAPKQLAMLDGRPLLDHAVATMSTAPVDDVLVVLGARAEEILEHVDLGRARAVKSSRWHTGKAASLQAAAAAVAPGTALVVVLADQPCITSAAIARVVEARDDTFAAVRATYGGVPGHPVVLEPAVLARVDELHDDEGAAALLGDHAVRDVPCDGLGDPVDVDRPEDLAALQSRRR